MLAPNGITLKLEGIYLQYHRHLKIEASQEGGHRIEALNLVYDDISLTKEDSLEVMLRRRARLPSRMSIQPLGDTPNEVSLFTRQRQAFAFQEVLKATTR